jgi:hypothetical protein
MSTASASRRLQRWRGTAWLLPLLAILGFGLELRAFWPGLMSTDSFEQYVQAALHRYNDHHPPIMAWVWSLTDRVITGPAGMLILHLSLLWLGLWSVAEGARRRGFRYTWLILLIGVTPWISNIAGVIWKDIGMACALLAAAGLLYDVEDDGERLRFLVIATAFILIGYATMVRANGFFAALPLAAYAVATARPRAAFTRAAAIGVVFVALVLGGQQLLERKVLDASPRHLSQLVMLYDLAGIACRGGEIDIPTPFRKPGYDAGALCRAYDPDQVDSLFFVPKGPLQMSLDGDAVQKLRGEWLAAATQHPKLYLAHRLHSFAGLLGLHPVSEGDRYLRQPFMVPNSWGFAFTRNKLSSALDASVDALADSGLFSGALWIGVAAVLLVVIASRRLQARFEAVLLVSGLMNALSYLFLSLAPNYRFLYWTVLSASVALVLMLLRAVTPELHRTADAIASTN